jgi:hypothetical protein
MQGEGDVRCPLNVTSTSRRKAVQAVAPRCQLQVLHCPRQREVNWDVSCYLEFTVLCNDLRRHGISSGTTADVPIGSGGGGRVIAVTYSPILP